MGLRKCFLSDLSAWVLRSTIENDGVLEHRIEKVNDWIPHIKKLGADAIYFSPVFESDTHGYNTRDYTKIDTAEGADALLVRSAVMHDMEFDKKLKGYWKSRSWS